ncbi:unnamed protein product [Didymodactylos carnosus]|uniref:Uncharacterized protein n=1 Tax=Didymodactylos carnosus TaxID=1234261 RepID=A0A814G3J4_9BILA|nr:unnamed protein product [Didymodactylos carnosus]CAF3763162.1 unnamed protein product [Didymodactylos carnosus]
MVDYSVELSTRSFVARYAGSNLRRHATQPDINVAVNRIVPSNENQICELSVNETYVRVAQIKLILEYHFHDQRYSHPYPFYVLINGNRFDMDVEGCVDLTIRQPGFLVQKYKLDMFYDVLPMTDMDYDTLLRIHAMINENADEQSLAIYNPVLCLRSKLSDIDQWAESFSEPIHLTNAPLSKTHLLRLRYGKEDRVAPLPIDVKCYFNHPSLAHIKTDIYLIRNIMPFQQSENEFYEPDRNLNKIVHYLQRQDNSNIFRLEEHFI